MTTWPLIIAQTAATETACTTEAPVAFFPQLFSEIKNALIENGTAIGVFLPKIIIAIVLLIIGGIIAKLVRSFLKVTFKKINLDGISEKAGISQVLGKAGLKTGISEMIPKLIYGVILLFVIKMAAETAQIKDIVDVITSIIAFLPKVITASLILLIGFMVADMVQNVVQNALENVGVDYAKSLAMILFGFIFVIVLTVALSQLGIETELLKDSVKIILGGIAVALALALGLGLKKLAGNVVSGVYARDLYQVGTEIELNGELHKVAGVGPVTTKLTRQDGGFVILPNSRLIGEEVRGRSAE